MDALNAHCFSQPHWRLIARGLKPEPWFEQGKAEGTGGILLPREIKLRLGQRYFRFASSDAPRDRQIGGGWWIDYETFSTIRTFAQDNGNSLTETARLALALPIDWTRADRLISAILEQPLMAYAGKGKPAATAGDNWTPLQHLPIKQMFIPGLHTSGSDGAPIYQRAFPNPRITFAANP